MILGAQRDIGMAQISKTQSLYAWIGAILIIFIDFVPTGPQKRHHILAWLTFSKKNH